MTETTTTRKTLAELNENAREWTRSDGEITKTQYGVGTSGHARSGSHGKKVHLISWSETVGYDEAKRAAYEAECEAAGRRFSKRNAAGTKYTASASCNGNGQTGYPVKGWDTDQINCKHCGA